MRLELALQPPKKQEAASAAPKRRRPETKQERVKREKNRLSQQAFRNRKKAHMQTLELRVLHLEALLVAAGQREHSLQAANRALQDHLEALLPWGPTVKFEPPHAGELLAQ
jgi:hypothetical protein